MTDVLLAIVLVVHFLLLFSVWKRVRSLMNWVGCKDAEANLEVLLEPVDAKEQKLWKQILELKRERQKWDKLIDES